MWKRWLMMLSRLGLVAARRIWPEFQVDSLSVWLVGIAAVLFVLPEVRSAMPYIKSVKVGEPRCSCGRRSPSEAPRSMTRKRPPCRHTYRNISAKTRWRSSSSLLRLPRAVRLLQATFPASLDAAALEAYI
jgi:hypothetical protein